MRHFLFLGLLSLPLIVAGPASAQIQITTATDGFIADGECSLREAVQAANTNAPVDACSDASGAYDTVTSGVGTITLTVTGADEDANQTGDIDVLESLTLSAQIDGNETDRGVDVHPGVETFQFGGLVQNGRSTNGGGIRIGAGVTSVLTATFEHNSAERTVEGEGYGGGVLTYGTLDCSRCTFDSNGAWSGGGLSTIGGYVTMPSVYGSVYNSATNGEYFSNVGGEVILPPSYFEFTGTIWSSGTLDLRGMTFYEAGSTPVTIAGGDATITGGTIESGILLITGGTVDVRSTVIAEGAVAVSGGTVHLTNVVVRDFRGSGLVVSDAADVTLDNTIIAGNDRAISKSGPSTLRARYSDIYGNGRNYGILQEGTEGTLVLESTNLMGFAGRGLISEGGTVSLTNTMVVRNGGGGILIESGDLSITSSTVAGNSAPDAGGGVRLDGGAAVALGSIFGDNTAPVASDLQGPITSDGYNLFETTDGATGLTLQPTDLSGIDPDLRGESVRTGVVYIPNTESPAIDAGWPGATTDVRGFDRTSASAGSQPDIGAYEREQSGIANEEGISSDGPLTLGISPNPLRGEGLIRFSAREAGQFEVVVYDVLGRRVATLFDGLAQAGVETGVALEGQSLPTGAYVVRLVGAAGAETRTVTVVR